VRFGNHRALFAGEDVNDPVFDHPSLSLLSSRLQATVAGKETETRSSAKFASSLRDPPVELRVEAAALALSSNLPSEH
jgi:hypothetical protein